MGSRRMIEYNDIAYKSGGKTRELSHMIYREDQWRQSRSGFLPVTFCIVDEHMTLGGGRREERSQRQNIERIQAWTKTTCVINLIREFRFVWFGCIINKIINAPKNNADKMGNRYKNARSGKTIVSRIEKQEIARCQRWVNYSSRLLTSRITEDRDCWDFWFRKPNIHTMGHEVMEEPWVNCKTDFMSTS